MLTDNKLTGYPDFEGIMMQLADERGWQFKFDDELIPVKSVFNQAMYAPALLALAETELSARRIACDLTIRLEGESNSLFGARASFDDERNSTLGQIWRLLASAMIVEALPKDGNYISLEPLKYVLGDTFAAHVVTEQSTKEHDQAKVEGRESAPKLEADTGGASSLDALESILEGASTVEAPPPAAAVVAPVAEIPSIGQPPEPAEPQKPAGGFLKRAQAQGERNRETHRAALDYLNILKSLAPVFKAATIYPGHDASPDQIGAAIRKMSQVSVGLANYIATQGDKLELDGAWARKTLHDFTAELVATHWITTVIGKGGVVPGHSPEVSVDYFVPAIRAVMELPADLPRRAEKLHLSTTGAVQLSLLKSITPIAIEVEKFATLVQARIPSAKVSADDLVMEVGQFVMEQATTHHERFVADNPDVTDDDRRAMLQALLAHTSSVMLSAWEYCRGEVLGALKDAGSEAEAATVLSQAGFTHGFPLEVMKARAMESMRRLTGASQYALGLMRQSDPANAKGAARVAKRVGGFYAWTVAGDLQERKDDFKWIKARLDGILNRRFRHESFDEAVARLGLTDEDLKKRTDYLASLGFLFGLITALALLFLAATPLSPSPLNHALMSSGVACVAGTKYLAIRFRREGELMDMAAMPPAIYREACIEQAAAHYRAYPDIIRAVIRAEGGTTGKISRNKDGSFDMGLMQVNSVHLPELARYGITQEMLVGNECLNIMIGTQFPLQDSVEEHRISVSRLGASAARPGSAAMNPAKSNNQDDELLWVLAGLFVLVVAAWFLGHEKISAFVMKVRAFESHLLVFDVEARDAIKEWIATTRPRDATLLELWQSGIVAGRSLRWAVFVILTGLFGYLFYRSPERGTKYTKVYTTETLARQEAEVWPVIQPVLGQNILDIPINDPVNGMRQLPRDYGRRHGFIAPIAGLDEKENPANIEILDQRSALRLDRAREIFAKQLGKPWQGASALRGYERALFAACAAQINNDNKLALDIVNDLARSFIRARKEKNAALINSIRAQKALSQYGNSKPVKRIASRHAYTRTVLMSMLSEAHACGVLPPSWFRWLKTVDRVTWYALHEVGLDVAGVEAAGLRSQWMAETMAKTPILNPMIEPALSNTVVNMLRAIWRKLKAALRPSVKVKLTRKNLFITLAGDLGGEFHVLPRAGLTEATKFAVAASGDGYVLEMTSGGGKASLAHFPGEGEARAALEKLNKALTGNQVGKWIGRAVVLWLGWLLVTSYLQVSQPAQESALESNAPTAFMPPPSTGLQEFPTASAADGLQAKSENLADDIYQQAMAAKARAERENMPPKVNDNTTGLDSFGLDTGAQAGPGCDPKLAFKVPQQ
ncbi:hypothetical protein DFQ30_007198 [Apophysomyces sp. BC1015]|nr:hypothetical protein DFQ30_007198 [Apophysomyces sp. BC1015]